MKAIFFGSIGTLCNSADLRLEGYNQSFSDHGLDWHWDRRTFAPLLAIHGGRERLQHYARSTPAGELDDILLDAVHRGQSRVFNALLQEGHARARPGILRLLSEARADGIKLGFVTTHESDNLDALFSSETPPVARDMFDIVIDSRVAIRQKPDPHSYLLALQALDCEPYSAWAITDSRACVKAAYAAGIPAIGTPNEFGDGEDFREALACVDCLGDASQPARQLTGFRVVRDGRVALGSLRELMPDTSPRRYLDYA